MGGVGDEEGRVVDMVFWFGGEVGGGWYEE